MPSRSRSARSSSAPAAAEDDDLARVRRREPLADLDGGGLAGAVGAEQAEALARTDLEVEAVDRDDVAVGLAELADEERAGEPACGKSNAVARRGAIPIRIPSAASHPERARTLRPVPDVAGILTLGSTRCARDDGALAGRRRSSLLAPAPRPHLAHRLPHPLPLLGPGEQQVAGEDAAHVHGGLHQRGRLGGNGMCSMVRLPREGGGLDHLGVERPGDAVARVGSDARGYRRPDRAAATASARSRSAPRPARVARASARASSGVPGGGLTAIWISALRYSRCRSRRTELTLRGRTHGARALPAPISAQMAPVSEAEQLRQPDGGLAGLGAKLGVADPRQHGGVEQLSQERALLRHAPSRGAGSRAARPRRVTAPQCIQRSDASWLEQRRAGTGRPARRSRPRRGRPAPRAAARPGR